MLLAPRKQAYSQSKKHCRRLIIDFFSFENCPWSYALICGYFIIHLINTRYVDRLNCWSCELLFKHNHKGQKLSKFFYQNEYLVFSFVYTWLRCPIIPRFYVISEMQKKRSWKFVYFTYNLSTHFVLTIFFHKTYVHICQNKAIVKHPAILPWTAIRVWIKCTDVFCLVVFNLRNM